MEVRGAVAGDLNLIFRGAPAIRLPGGWFPQATYTYRPSSIPGVVTYEIDNPGLVEQLQEAMQNNGNRVPVLPLPRFPIPVIL